MFLNLFLIWLLVLKWLVIDKEKKELTSFGDLCSDFGANVKFLIGQKKKYKKINIGNLKTIISNKK